MSKRFAVVAVAILAIVGFGVSAFYYNRSAEVREAQVPAPASVSDILIRAHAPVLGAENGRVTIVEFFDPSCEACRAMYPVVKQIMAEHPNDVRLVLRYAPLHQGSEEAIKILEGAREQGIFVPVLEAVLASQPEWHDDARAERAWAAASSVGLNVERARQTTASPEFTKNLNQDVADLSAIGVKGTPTFYVNGKVLSNIGAEQLSALVKSEVAATR
ncbi:Outer membrane protein [Novosphingobium lubricantis]|uniref:Outer membrane protein n=1 Tax=Novosphingobium pentaromativorans US6-1 TaxID=1088721 RepID=G6EKB8_9SPHN|nr:thioredoxin domain-containing protein [Novosphingobium pentaromativorans]AIT82421.1 DSBA oxidoreductase [Novosphingobium pentaromativorans US6-1]EHJ58259.1 outer membrane protein [Novosphingobium pentaromativorans US6-1]